MVGTVAVMNQAIESIRSLSMELAPPVLREEGLAVALRWLSSVMKERHSLEVDLQTDPAADPSEESNRDLMFQAARELLLNVVKHAKTNRACLRLYRENPDSVLEVIDRGTGFDPRQPRAARRSLGLFHMRERLEAVNGRLVIDSEPGRGTQVTIRLPLVPAVRRPTPNDGSRNLLHSGN